MTEAISFRRAGPADAPAIDALTRAAYAQWVPVVGREPRPMTVDYTAAVRAHPIDLIEEDGKLAGLIEMSIEADHLLIVNLAVAGGGAGSANLASAGGEVAA